MFFTNLLQGNLKVKNFATKIIYYPKTESTSDDLWELYNENHRLGLLVISDNQTKGRGRLNKSWISSPGLNLTFSFMLDSSYLKKHKELISLIIPLAIINGVNYFTSINLKLKWPNDIMYTKKKVGGILIESKTNKENTIYNIGVGINVNDNFENFNKTLKQNITSLKLILNQSIQREPLLASILNNLDELILFYTKKDIIDLWNKNCSHMNQNISFNINGKLISGKFCGINNKGQALIKINNEIITYNGEIQLI